VHLAIGDATLRLALAFAVDRAGWAEADASNGALFVADRVSLDPGHAPVDVLVVPPSPAAARRALDAFTDGAARSVLRATDPKGLPLALELARRGLGVVPAAIVESARAVPPLDERLERTLELVLQGWSNPRIARAVHHSEATTKRDVAELLRRFDAPNRVALAATALRLGLHPRA
jgi:DNA-binding NarL/FixJ family response regulator